MPSKRPHIPQVSRHKATGQAVVRLGGKDFYLGLYGSTSAAAEYEQLIAEWLANGKQLPSKAAELSVDHLVLAYWRFAKTYYVKDGRPSGHLALVKSALRYLRRQFGHRPASQFGPLALQSLQERLVHAGLSRGYINGHVGRIKRAFKWAVSRELIPAAVYHGIATVPGLRRGRTAAYEPEPIRPVDAATVELTLPHLPPVVADMVRLHQIVGCRPGELCIMRPCDIDASGDIWWYTPHSFKTQHHGGKRCIPIGPRAQGSAATVSRSRTSKLLLFAHGVARQAIRGHAEAP